MGSGLANVAVAVLALAGHSAGVIEEVLLNSDPESTQLAPPQPRPGTRVASRHAIEVLASAAGHRHARTLKTALYRIASRMRTIARSCHTLRDHPVDRSGHLLNFPGADTTLPAPQRAKPVVSAGPGWPIGRAPGCLLPFSKPAAELQRMPQGLHLHPISFPTMLRLPSAPHHPTRRTTSSLRPPRRHQPFPPHPIPRPNDRGRYRRHQRFLRPMTRRPLTRPTPHHVENPSQGRRDHSSSSASSISSTFPPACWRHPSLRTRPAWNAAPARPDTQPLPPDLDAAALASAGLTPEAGRPLKKCRHPRPKSTYC